MSDHPALEKLRADGAGEAVIATFAQQLERLRAGERGTLAEGEIEPVAKVPDAEELPEPSDDEAAELLDRAVVLKLNGGLGTSMGMTGPKSLIEAKDGLTFLEVVAKQVLALRERTGARLPLVLMNSFATREATMSALGDQPELAVDAPADFVQNRVPKLRADDHEPVEWPDAPELEWAPPGHGDLYAALVTSGTLDALLERGFRYAFVSNSDNLGATLEPRILAWMAREEIPFVMEVAERTEADRKGGHIAERAGGEGLVLREVAQTPDEDLDAFQDVGRHRFFNTNTLWVDLEALHGLLRERDGVLGLPMIVNAKTVDPTDSSSPDVVQLETAMGAAIASIPGARAVRVPRSRLVPVKTTNDLLVLRSDAYVLGDDGSLALGEGRGAAPLVDLDPEHFKLMRDFEAHLPEGAPSLREAERLTVRGDVTFGRDVVVRGEATVEGPQRVEDGVVLGE